jgi:hypothetical protein
MKQDFKVPEIENRHSLSHMTHLLENLTSVVAIAFHFSMILDINSALDINIFSHNPAKLNDLISPVASSPCFG